MSGDSSEEKTLPPSAKKLRDAREKGQIAKAPDLITALAGVAVIAYLYGSADWIMERLRATITVAADRAPLPFDEALRQIATNLGHLAFQVLAPVLALTLLAVVGGSMLVNGGFMLVLEPLKPKLETLNPIKGIGNLFAMKALVELLKSIVKAVLFGAVAVRLALTSAVSLVHLPSCGTRCTGPVTSGMLQPLIATACAVYLAAGVADLLLQKWLFKRDMKMSVTEQKRERKDQDGDPFVRRAQRQRRREAATSVQLGFDRATIIIGGDDAALGLRYKKGETDFPVVVCRGVRDTAPADLVRQARAAATPLFWDNALAIAMCARHKPGDRILAEYFPRVAQALFASGAVRNV